MGEVAAATLFHGMYRKTTIPVFKEAFRCVGKDEARHMGICLAILDRLLPLLTELGRRDPVPVLVRQADLLRDESDLLDLLAADLDPADADALADAHPAVARRAVRRWLTDGYPPDAATVERVLAVARGEAVATEIGGGRRVERSRRRLHLRPSETDGPNE